VSTTFYDLDELVLQFKYFADNMKNIITKDAAYKNLINKIGETYIQHRDVALSMVDPEWFGQSKNELNTEPELEERLLDHLQKFLLELGKGFAFIKRQYRITINNHHYRIDLVFYHYILKCFILIDLKSDKLEHYDVGQMNMYINYFKTEVSQAEDNPPIGIILAADKDEILVEYATGGITNQLFVSKYQLYLPDKAALQAQVRAILERENGNEN